MMSSAPNGMLSKEAARKSVLATFVDLYKSDLAFRGMLDFAIVGALVLMFLDPPNHVHWPWRPDEVRPGPVLPEPVPNKTTDDSPVLPHPAPHKNTVAGPAIPIPFGDVFKNPHIGTAYVIDIDPKPFQASSAADRPRLAAARAAIMLWRPDDAIEDLRAADANDPNVAFLRGAAFAFRQDKDSMHTAEALVRQAVDGGNAQAKAMLGTFLLDPQSGVANNAIEAKQLIEAGVAAGDRQAMRVAGIGYMSGEFGVLDAARGADLLKRAADAGDAVAMAIYARLLADGIGVGGVDATQAERYLRQAAGVGLTGAQETLGNWLVEQFGAGLLPDPKEGIDWLTKAYVKGHSLSALLSLAHLHDTVAKSPPWKDIPRAAAYLRLCSGLSWGLCQFDTAAAWKMGEFGSANEVLARAHLAIALSLGDSRAQGALTGLDKALTPAEIAAANTNEQKLRAELKPVFPVLALQYADIPAPPPPKAVSSDLRGLTGIPDIQFGDDAGNQSTGNASADLDELRQRAQSEFEDKNFDRAVATFTEIISKGQPTWEDYNHRGMTYHAKEQLDLAIADYNRALSLNDNSDVHYNRGLVYRDKGKLDDALADFDAATRLKNTDPSYFVARGQTQFMRSDFQSAIQDFDKVIDLALKDPSTSADDKAAYYFMRGRSKAQAGVSQAGQCRTFAGATCDSSEQYMAAAADFQLALKEKPNAADALFQLGWVAEELGNHRQAIDQYSAAIRADPDNSTAYNNRGVIYGNMGQSELAFADYNDAIRTNPKNESAWTNRGILFANTGNRRRAVEDFRQALVIDPDNAYAIDQLRRVGIKVSRPGGAGVDTTGR